MKKRSFAEMLGVKGEDVVASTSVPTLRKFREYTLKAGSDVSCIKCHNEHLVFMKNEGAPASCLRRIGNAKELAKKGMEETQVGDLRDYPLSVKCAIAFDLVSSDFHEDETKAILRVRKLWSCEYNEFFHITGKKKLTLRPLPDNIIEISI